MILYMYFIPVSTLNGKSFPYSAPQSPERTYSTPISIYVSSCNAMQTHMLQWWVYNNPSNVDYNDHTHPVPAPFVIW